MKWVWPTRGTVVQTFLQGDRTRQGIALKCPPEQVIQHYARLSARGPGQTTVIHRDLGNGAFRFIFFTQHLWFGEMFYQEGVFHDPLEPSS